jgi:hypothetical protein
MINEITQIKLKQLLMCMELSKILVAVDGSERDRKNPN